MTAWLGAAAVYGALVTGGRSFPFTDPDASSSRIADSLSRRGEAPNPNEPQERDRLFIRSGDRSHRQERFHA